MIIYEYPTEVDEESCSQISEAYFDHTNTTDNETGVSSFEVNRESNNEREKALIIQFKQNKIKKKISSEVFKMSTDHSKPPIDAGDKIKSKEIPAEKSSSESYCSKPQTVMSPCTQIFDVPNTKPKNKFKTLVAHEKNLGLNCPDVGSDEFADIEDNNSESSESLKSLKIAGLTKKYLEGILGGDEITMNKVPKKDAATSSSSSTSTTSSSESEIKAVKSASESNVRDTENTNTDASASGSNLSPRSLEKFQASSADNMFCDERKRSKIKMPTISEDAEPENKLNDATSSQTSHSRPNPLKMKSKVGNKKIKCNVCNVRLGLCAIKCRCGGYYCAKHRYDKEHDCTFDYKSMGAEEIRKNNPQVIAEKVRKL